MQHTEVVEMASDKRVDEIIDKYEGEKGFLIQLLLDIQREFNWVPKEAIERISTRLQIPLSHIYRVVSFYKVLSLKPIGRHLIQVCLGTACHVRGGPRILEEVENVLGIGAGTTTDDMKFTVNRVNCIGCCALGPVMIIDNDYHGKLTPAAVKTILGRYE
jgi:NADH-quinone oxidoreductase subunit E